MTKTINNNIISPKIGPRESVRIKDEMLLREMLDYTPRKNVDRIVSFAIALFASRSNTNRGFKLSNKVKEYKPKAKRVDRRFTKTYSSPFQIKR